MFGRKTGEQEDKILSLFNGDYDAGCHHILLMDDFDEILSSVQKTTTDGRKNPGGNLESHASARALLAFLSALDTMCATSLRLQTRATLVCTARTNSNLSLLRFDTVYKLKMPSYEERRTALSKFVWREKGNQGQIKNAASLDHLAELTVGLSHAEIAQNCRRAIAGQENTGLFNTASRTSDCKRDIDENTFYLLEALKASFQSFAPASLRSGVVDGYVDMRVWSGKDLMDWSRRPPDLCPLFGKANDLAWKALESNIVIPLCRAKELNRLLFDRPQASVSGELSCGVVLTGPAGSGKSTIARHCAALAASLLPSVKLLEVSCTSIIHKEVGASEKAIRHLFECARSAAPCVVILDDVATISSVRGSDNTTEGTMDRVLSTLLTELDGVEEKSAASGEAGGFALIGITQEVSWVDPALLRPGK